MIRFAFFIFIVVASVDATCTTKNGGQTCLCSSQVPKGFKRYFKKGDPCFRYGKSKNLCFTSVNGNSGTLGVCDPNSEGCKENCDAETSSSSENSSIMTCDNSDLASSDCSAYKATYCKIKKNHTLCKYCGTDTAKCNKVCSRGITSQADKDAIVKLHNKLRKKVARGEESRGVGGGQPSAAKMYKLKWNEELAEIAQAWADQCTWKHDKQRNMAMTMSSNPPDMARNYTTGIMGWYDEVEDFPPQNVDSYSNTGATGVVGHYTQVVWGATKEVGCGYVAFKNENSEYHRAASRMPYIEYLVCNYGKGANMRGAKVYTTGETASGCPKGKINGLCKWW